MNKTPSVDTSKSAEKDELTNRNSDVDQLDIDNLETVFANLSKQSNVEDNVKNAVHNPLVTKVNTLKKFLIRVNIVLLLYFINFPAQYLMKD